MGNGFIRDHEDALLALRTYGVPGERLVVTLDGDCCLCAHTLSILFRCSGLQPAFHEASTMRAARNLMAGQSWQSQQPAADASRSQSVAARSMST